MPPDRDLSRVIANLELRIKELKAELDKPSLGRDRRTYLEGMLDNTEGILTQTKRI